MSKFPNPKPIKAGETTFAVYEADGDPDRKRPPVLLVHGWPEIAYTWKNQLGPLADAGFRVIAFDLKGFGYSDAPKDPSLYDAKTITEEFCGLLDALEIDKAIFCGHDWGGSLIWSMAQLHPERVAGAIGLCTPLRRRAPVEPISILRKRFGDIHYFVQFQTPEVPETLFATDVERFVKLMFRRPVARDKWAALVPDIFDVPGRFKNASEPSDSGMIISPEDAQVYIDAYRHSGFHGGINLYRNVDENWRYMANRDEMVRVPSLWVGAELDLFLPPETASDMDELVSDLEKHLIPDCGHWVTWEKPNEVNNIMIDWLNRRFST
ncbi:alpha/beta fold hydrolase [Hyphococcus sp. DH-69]|uniref:alpha/beta fold hydrolase n=1 Tax=Hyphococcus formosus TaxID=3143534 RepID=UPI00398AD33A